MTTSSPSPVSLPGIGALRRDKYTYVTEPLSVAVLGSEVEFDVDWDPRDPGDARDAVAAEIAQTITRFREAPRAVLDAATHAVYTYYRDTRDMMVADQDEYYLEEVPDIDDPAAVWDMVTFGQYPLVRQADGTWYVSLECGCAWEEEHGLQIVFRNGDTITKLGPFDDFLSWPEGLKDRSGDGVYCDY